MGKIRHGMSPSKQAQPDRLTLLAFAAFATLIAANVVGIRFSNRELPPFWGAGVRLACASLFFFLYVAIKRYPLPRGRALHAALLFGILQFGIGFGLGYWGLQEVPAGLGSVVFAAMPLFTLFYSSAAGLETITARGIAGAITALSGIAVVYGERVGTDFPPVFLFAIIGAAASFALVPVLLKKVPPVHPSSMNAIGMLTGASLLLGLSFVIGERAALPQKSVTWAAFLFLVLFGSVGAFAIFQFVVKRWTASGVSFHSVLSPFVTVFLSAWLLDESLSRGLLVGAILVISGTYVGALHPRQSDT